MGLRRLLVAANRPQAPLAPTGPARNPARRSGVVLRTGTALEVSELAWLAEGVSRETALSIPAVAACRNLIVGTVVQLSMYRYRAGERLEPDALTTRPDPSTTIAATLSGTIDDLIFSGRAYWRILDRDPDGFPRAARWTPFRDVTPETDSGSGSYSALRGYRVAGLDQVLDPDELIRFDSPIPGVLDVGGRTLAGAIETYEAQRRYAGVELPAGTLNNKGGQVSPEEAEEIVADFQAKRREHSIAFLQGIEYQRESLSPADLQLKEMTDAIATEIARLFNVPVSMIGASPSGNASALLYSNLSQQEALQMLHAVGPHLRTVELTLTEAYPRGTSVAFNRTPIILADPQAAAEYATGLLAADVIDRTEARAFLGIPTSPAPADDLTPGKV